MSGIAGLFDVPGTETDLDTWAFQHAAHHRDINRRIYELTQISLPEYILDPMNPNDLGVWTYQHQIMHTFMDAILGISGSNLLEINWKDPSQRAGWIFLNASEHQDASDILGIG